MEIGVGLPTFFEGSDRDLLTEWTRRADEGPFSSLSAGERLVFPNHEMMVSLSMAAVVSTRIRIMTSPIYLPMHAAGVVAKQAATLDALTGGRLVLGVGIGAHKEDFVAAASSYETRGSRFEEQVLQMRGIWAGSPTAPGHGSIGPAPRRPGGPEILVAAWNAEVIEMAPRIADGLMTFGFSDDPTSHRLAYEDVVKGWREIGRSGSPRFVAGTFFALGGDSSHKAEAYLRSHYGFLSEAAQRQHIEHMSCKSETAIRRMIDRFENAGVDELFFTPTIAELDQIDRLAELVGA